jgi:multicomponent K+:H+ antiporter subunit D
MLAGGLFATVALARAGSRIFWKVGATPAAVARLDPREFAAIAFLAACSVALTVFAAPAQRYAAATAAQLAAPRDYVRAVLDAPPVPSPGGRHGAEGAPR